MPLFTLQWQRRWLISRGQTNAAGRALEALGAPGEALISLQGEERAGRAAAGEATVWELLKTRAVQAELRLGACDLCGHSSWWKVHAV